MLDIVMRVLTVPSQGFLKQSDSLCLLKHRSSLFELELLVQYTVYAVCSIPLNHSLASSSTFTIWLHTIYRQ